MSGEIILAIAYGAVMVVAGAIVHWIVSRDYAPKVPRDDED